MIGRVRQQLAPSARAERDAVAERAAVASCIDGAIRDASAPDLWTGAQVVDLLLDLRTQLVGALEAGRR